MAQICADRNCFSQDKHGIIYQRRESSWLYLNAAEFNRAFCKQERHGCMKEQEQDSKTCSSKRLSPVVSMSFQNIDHEYA